jgi:orotate phosphoribosyltransferase
METKSLNIVSKDNYFTWASGIKSPIYCDNRRLLSHPQIRSKIIEVFIKKIDKKNTHAIAAVATAGISWGAIIADRLNLPLIYIRSNTKAHGKQNIIEGNTQGIKEVVLIEDLISTGKSSMEAIENLSKAHIKTSKLLSLYSYNLEKAINLFRVEDVVWESIDNINTLFSSDYINKEQKDNLREFLCLLNS